MYDSKVGRWLSEDPLGFEAGDVNLNGYVGNRPVTFVDPDGLQAAGVVVQDEAAFRTAARESVKNLNERTQQVVLDRLNAMHKKGGIVGALTYEAIARKKVTFEDGKFPMRKGTSLVIELGSVVGGDGKEKWLPLFGAEESFNENAKLSGSGGDFVVPRFCEELPLNVPYGPFSEEEIKNAQMLILLHEFGHAALNLSDYVNWIKLPESVRDGIDDGNPEPYDEKGVYEGIGTKKGVNPSFENLLRPEFDVRDREAYLHCPLRSQPPFDEAEVGRINDFLRDYGLGRVEQRERDVGGGVKQKYLKRVP